MISKLSDKGIATKAIIKAKLHLKVLATVKLMVLEASIDKAKVDSTMDIFASLSRRWGILVAVKPKIAEYSERIEEYVVNI